MSAYYSAAKVRRSLLHFAVGKVFGATIGLLTLLLLVRTLSLSDYGVYVACVAYIEIFLVVSSGALSAVSERLVPEARAQGEEARLRRLVIRLVLCRVLFAMALGGCAAVLVILFADDVGVTEYGVAFLVLQLIAVAESIARFCDTILDSLLLQARSQISLIFRTGAKLACLAWVTFHWGSVPLETWFWFEAGVYLLGAGFAVIILSTTISSYSHVRGVPLKVRPALKASIQIYVSQCMASLTGVDLAKILILRATSPEISGAFGFCAALAAMVQRYLPSYLLVGMVRPLVVAAISAGDRGRSRLNKIVSVLLKLNFLLVGCLIAVAVALGDEVVELLSGGRVKGAGLILSLLLLFVLTNSGRAIFGHVALAKGCGTAVLCAQLISVFVFVTASLIISPSFASVGFPLALITMNTIWCIAVVAALRLTGYPPSLPTWGCSKIVAVITASSGLGLLLSSYEAMPAGLASTLWLMALIVLFYFAAAIALQPFEVGEREAISKLLPRRWLIV